MDTESTFNSGHGGGRLFCLLFDKYKFFDKSPTALTPKNLKRVLEK
jgi:hypothetical protein